MNLEDLRLPDALKTETAAFAAQYGDAIGGRLTPALPMLDAQLKALGGPQAPHVRRHYLRAEAIWEKFFWARLGVHLIDESKPLPRALQLAEEDLLALTATLHAL